MCIKVFLDTWCRLKGSMSRLEYRIRQSKPCPLIGQRARGILTEFSQQNQTIFRIDVVEIQSQESVMVSHDRDDQWEAVPIWQSLFRLRVIEIKIHTAYHRPCSEGLAVFEQVSSCRIPQALHLLNDPLARRIGRWINPRLHKLLFDLSDNGSHYFFELFL